MLVGGAERMIGLWIYRTFFQATLDRLELVLFIDRMARKGYGFNELAARHEIEKGR